MGGRLSYPVVDLSGKVAVVTGGNTGIGYETAKALAVMGAHTIIACRSEERATAAIQRMNQEVANEFPGKNIKIEFMRLDLASFRSTKEFVSAFRDRNLPLHLLINNGAIAPMEYDRTEDGNEMSYQVNHLSHFLLTLELLPIILESAAATGDCRIVIVSSKTHRSVQWEPEKINADEQFTSMMRTLKYYAKSKLYNVMMAYALQRRLGNVGVTVSTLHPGIVNTGAYRYVESSHLYMNLLGKVVRPFMRDVRGGAATTINCAVNPELNDTQHCFYYDDCRPENSSITSRNEQYQEHLWEISVSAVKDYLSPESLEKYGHANRPTQSAEVGREEVGQQEGGEGQQEGESGAQQEGGGGQQEGESGAQQEGGGGQQEGESGAQQEGGGGQQEGESGAQQEEGESQQEGGKGVTQHEEGEKN